MKKGINLAEEFAKCAYNPYYKPEIKTIDDFYDYYKIPKEARTGFGTASILKQALAIIDKWNKINKGIPRYPIGK